MESNVANTYFRANDINSKIIFKQTFFINVNLLDVVSISGVKIKYTRNFEDFFAKLAAVFFYLAFSTFYVGVMYSKGYSYAFALTGSFAIGVFIITTIGFFIICTICVFLRKCIRNFRRCCSCFKKGGAKTIKELLLEAGHQISTDWTVAEQAGKFYLKDFCRLLKKQYKHQKIGLLLAGSVGERFGKPTCSDLDKCRTDLMTDFDYMVYLEGISAVTVIERDSDIYIQTKEKGIMNGYAKLYCTPNLTPTFPTKRGGVLSAGHLMKKLYELLDNTDVSFYPGFISYFYFFCFSWVRQYVDIQQNGPALRVQIQRNFCFFLRNCFVADIVFSIYSPEWPEASDWPTRRERNWPSVSDVENITKNGCHLIPKSQANDKKKITWRFSFSYAEVQLSMLINQSAKNCYLCLKIISRHYLQPKCEKFKSYHLKSIFYYTLEKTQIELWADHNIEKGFEKLLDELLQTLNERRCPHFWISNINLYQGIEKKSLKSLYRTALKIQQNPAPYIKEMVGLCGDVFPHKMVTYIHKRFYSDGRSKENEEKLGEPPEEIICIK